MFDEEQKEVAENLPYFDFMASVPTVGPSYSVGIVGASGLVGKTLIRILHQRRFPVGQLSLYGSANSAGRWIETSFGLNCILPLNPRKPQEHDFVFMAAGTEAARKWGWRFARRGAVVIDKSSYFRMKPYAPLVAPLVNPQALDNFRGIIANPNCTTIPLVSALHPLHREFGLKHLVCVSFQSVSGSGKDGVTALGEELENSDRKPTTYPHRIAHNVIPWIGEVAGAFSGEELKMANELRKIMELRKLPVQATAVRVPVLVGHSIAVHANFSKSVDADRARQILSETEGIIVVDDPHNNEYPTPLLVAGRDETFVGRIRRDRGRHGLAFWLSADNLRKGAALNAVQIAETVLARNIKG